MGKQIIPNGCYYLHDRIMSNGEQKIYIRYFVRGEEGQQAIVDLHVTGITAYLL